MVELLGRGGMGEVWKASDDELQRAVAVKILRDGGTSAEAVSRFRREATIGARLRHPGIAIVHDIGRDAGQLFIVMELLEGRDLAAALSESPNGLPVEEVLSLGVQIADGLAAAHDQGVVHRDLKPANVFLHQGCVKICDFGISRSADSTAGLTSTGRPFGTPLYMAPEQWRGEHVDARCDLYALGCILYAMLTGTPPFTGDFYTLMRQHADQVPRSPRAIRPEIPLTLEALVLALLAKDPQARPATAHTTRTALAAITASFGPSVGPGQNSVSNGASLVNALIDQADTASKSDLTRAQSLGNAAVEVATHLLGPHHPGTLAARSRHAAWVGKAGDAAAARDLYATLATDCIRVLGPDHPHTLSTRNHHANWVATAGDATAARALYTALAADDERVLGPDHPETLATRSHHANWVGKAGDAAAARDLYRALATGCTRVLGPDHPSTLATRNNHANWVGIAGDAAAARNLYITLATDYDRVLGPDHPDTLAIRNHHANWVGRTGDAVAARDLYRALATDCTRVLGPDHPDTQATRNNHVHWGEVAARAAG
ncbi:protein kinase [Streptomyces sp. NPDC101132]|uniref:serine/threonine-protein kinase n=1 Tax=Streptomyces sp. NPDC101132 TaxID=3366110 RepID=UPI003828846E